MSNTRKESPAPILLKDIVVNAQYIKGMNVLIPHAPSIFSNMPNNPYITVTVDVNAKQLADNPNSFEVMTTIGCISTKEPRSEDTKEYTIIFDVQLHYAAIVTLPTLQAPNLEDILMVHTPDLLFPEIRNVVFNITRGSSLPPLLLQRIDFASLWKEKKETAAKK